MTEWDGFHETVAAKSDQIITSDLSAGSLTITISGCSIRPKEDQPVTIRIADSEKTFKPCKGMRRALLHVWGKAGPNWIGRMITLFNDPDVVFSGKLVGGVRISAMSDISGDVKVIVPVSRGKVKQYVVKPIHRPQQLVADAPAVPSNALELCHKAAREGTESFKNWWNTEEGKSCRRVSKENLSMLQELAKAADGPIDAAPPM